MHIYIRWRSTTQVCILKSLQRIDWQEEEEEEDVHLELKQRNELSPTLPTHSAIQQFWDLLSIRMVACTSRACLSFHITSSIWSKVGDSAAFGYDPLVASMLMKPIKALFFCSTFESLQRHSSKPWSLPSLLRLKWYTRYIYVCTTVYMSDFYSVHLINYIPECTFRSETVDCSRPPTMKVALLIHTT